MPFENKSKQTENVHDSYPKILMWSGAKGMAIIIDDLGLVAPLFWLTMAFLSIIHSDLLNKCNCCTMVAL
jgi:hypothetical protein